MKIIFVLLVFLSIASSEYLESPKLLDWVLGKYDPNFFPEVFSHFDANYTV